MKKNTFFDFVSRILLFVLFPSLSLNGQRRIDLVSKKFWILLTLQNWLGCILGILWFSKTEINFFYDTLLYIGMFWYTVVPALYVAGRAVISFFQYIIQN